MPKKTDIMRMPREVNIAIDFRYKHIPKRTDRYRQLIKELDFILYGDKNK